MAKHIPGPLYFEQLGRSGTPMIFLHSTPDDHRLWIFQTAHFSSWYRTIAVDLAGYGRSPIPQAGVTVGDQAAACWEVVDLITSGSVIIQGNSMGSLVARHMASQQPQRTLALILSGCGYQPNRDAMVRWKRHFQEEGLELREKQILYHFSPANQRQPLMQYYARMLVELNNEGTLASIIAMNDDLSKMEPKEFYDTITAPTLIISGAADPNHPTVFDLQKIMKGSELAIIEGAGHSSNFEVPWEFDRYCIEFLTKLGLFPG